MVLIKLNLISCRLKYPGASQISCNKIKFENIPACLKIKFMKHYAVLN